jgi:hypothetical protein
MRCNRVMRSLRFGSGLGLGLDLGLRSFGRRGIGLVVLLWAELDWVWDMDGRFEGFLSYFHCFRHC